MQHHRAMARRVLAHIFGIKSLWQNKIHLQGAALPVTTNRIAQLELELRAVERAFARIQFVLQTNTFHCRFQCCFRAVPGLVRAGPVCRAVREHHLDLGKAEVGIDLAQHLDKGGGFLIDLRFGAENMGIVLTESTRPHQAVQGAMGLVAEQGGELAETNRQIAVALQALIENLHMARAVHRLDGHVAVIMGADGEHVVAVFIPVAGLLPQLAVHHLRSIHFLIAVALHLAADVVLQGAAQAPALRVPEHAADRFFLLVEQAHLAAELAVIALFRFLDLLEVGVQLVLVAPGGAIDALQLRVVAVATPVGAGHLGQLETVAELAGAGQVGAAAKVDEVALAVQADFLIGRQVANDLGLEGLAHFQEEVGGLVAIPHFTADILVAFDDLVHALFDRLEIFRGEGLLAVKVVIEAIFNGRADGHLGAGKQFLHGLGHDMGGVVADQLKSVRVFTGNDLHRAAGGQGEVDVLEDAIDLDGQGLFGQFFADTVGQFQSGCRLVKCHLCPIGQAVRNAHEDASRQVAE